MSRWGGVSVYPLKLVKAKGHPFARWESADRRERFNIEATSNGCTHFRMIKYKQWPHPMSEGKFGSFKSIVWLSVLSFTMSACDERLNLDSRANRGRAGPFRQSTPSISPDGSAIVYDSAQSGSGDIYRLDFPDQKVSRITSTAEAEMHPLYSPDGSRIVFARQSEGYHVTQRIKEP